MADALARNEAPGADDRGWFLTAVNRYQARCRAGEAGSLDRELGLVRHGSNGWWTAEARERRNEAICELRERHFGHLNDGEAARNIAALAHRHAASPFRQRRTQDPDPDSLEALLRAALCTTCGFPGVKQLKAILGNRIPVCVFRNDISKRRS